MIAPKNKVITKKLSVHLNHPTQKLKLGILAQKERKIYFEYSKEFLKTTIEISPYKLPLKTGIIECKDSPYDNLFGVFADSLPDGWGRLLMDRHLLSLGVNPNSLNPLDRLSYVGKYGMGALSFEPSHKTDEFSFNKIMLDDLAKSSQNILEGSSEELIDELLFLGGSSAGARPKVLVQISKDKRSIIHGQQKLKKKFSHWIVKFASSSDPKDIGAIEYVYALLAKDAGLEVSEIALLESKKGRYFATKRFDRVDDDRVHMHSVAGLTHSDFRFPSLDYDDLLSLSLHLTKDFKEQEKMFRVACFNLFMHNRDDHAKNFSFLMDEQGGWKLSPMYDMTFSFGPLGEHSTTYMLEGKNPDISHLKSLAKKQRIKDADKIIDEVKKAVSNWGKYAKEVDISQKTIKEVEKFLKI
jgi:serine/threonine-protein kinase HipA